MNGYPNILYQTPDTKNAEAKALVDLYRSDAEHRMAAVIRLFKKADRSTVPHELAHIFFDDMREWVMSGQADNAARRDYASLLKWAGQLAVDPNLQAGTPEHAAQNVLRALQSGYGQVVLGQAGDPLYFEARQFF